MPTPTLCEEITRLARAIHNNLTRDLTWLGLNYGRLARLRLVTGYPEALDWSKDQLAPENDGIFTVDIKTGEKRLLVSYSRLARELKERSIDTLHDGLFINHTLWNRDCDRIYFFGKLSGCWWASNCTCRRR